VCLSWPFNSSNSFLLGLVFGTMERTLGSFGTLKDDLIIISEDEDDEEKEESIDETCKEAM